jgi:NNP family nitrate/nitrite transporter-like MFS transporter
MNNTLATHFEDYFGVDIVAAGLLATAFGGMNLFARSLGGILSDWMNARWKMQGRLWAHFISLFGQAVFLFGFGSVTSAMGWGPALVVLIIFSIFVNMAEGTSYGIVPYMIPDELAVVSAMVGAGGTLGAVIATWSFYKYVEDDLLPFKLHAAYVMFWALTCFLMRWDHMGSMFSQGPEEEVKTSSDKSPPAVTAVSMASPTEAVGTDSI